MSDLDRHIYTVSELTAEVRSLLEEAFAGIWVEGEVSNFKHHTSGHMYFTLKDATGQIQAVMFRGMNRTLKFRPEDGLHVLVFGLVTVYEQRGQYQIKVEYMEPKGVGALQLAFEQLKQRLAAEGLFAAERKRPIPLLPRRIGIITSPTGAAIRDMLNVITRRFANVEILIHPVLVQGEEAAPDIVAALEAMNRRGDLDVLILARGGGSIEDLWAFNEEVVARAIAASKIPVISAVGHETDFTIADFVADLRAPTPSAAAELVISRKDELAQRLDDLTGRMMVQLAVQVGRLRATLQGLERHLHLLNPRERIRLQLERVEEFRRRLAARVATLLLLGQERLRALGGRLDSLSPLAILGRGYSICRHLPSQAILKDAAAAAAGDAVEVILHRGALACTVKGPIREGDRRV